MVVGHIPEFGMISKTPCLIEGNLLIITLKKTNIDHGLNIVLYGNVIIRKRANK